MPGGRSGTLGRLRETASGRYAARMRFLLAPLRTVLMVILPAVPAHAAVWQAVSGVRTVVVATVLEHPLFVTSPPGDARLFVVEQPGRIRVIEGGKLRRAPFLDLSANVSYGGERGLLGLAFHPAFARNGFLYVNYTDRRGDTRIERYHVAPGAAAADPASAKLILAVKQPFANHNGGMVAFGPDGMLWIGMGDGGSGGDPFGNAQNRRALLGKLRRVDVDHGDPYAIPRDNPFADGRQGRGEIWSVGLRNPWRFSFDRGSPLLVVADVGQNKWEEIDAVDPKLPGLNYGWNLREGAHTYGLPRPAPARLVEPVLEYGHAAGCSIAGGYVYRGAAMPKLQGTYFFSDYCSGWLRSCRFRDGRAIELRQWDVGSLGQVLSLGEDAAGEIYVCTVDKVLRLELVPPR